MADYEYFNIEISRNYSPMDWREDLKKLMIKAGVVGRPIVFFFHDGQIKYESFMEDISMLLNSGDLPNLFPPDEKAEILDKLQSVARSSVGFKLFSFNANLYIYSPVCSLINKWISIWGRKCVIGAISGSYACETSNL